MTAPRLPALAISGSNSDGNLAYSCAVATSTGIRSATPTPGARADLAVLVAEACRAAGIRGGDLRELRLDLGPGSYTGLRVAVTFARFLQVGSELRILATDTLALIAAAAPPGAGRAIVPVLDARRGRLYAARCQWQGELLVTTTAPAALPAAAIDGFLQEGDLVVASAAVQGMIRAAAGALGVALQPLPPVHAAGLFAPGLSVRAVGPEQLEPLYLMSSYAEEGGASA